MYVKQFKELENCCALQMPKYGEEAGMVGKDLHVGNSSVGFDFESLRARDNWGTTFSQINLQRRSTAQM